MNRPFQQLSRTLTRFGPILALLAGAMQTLTYAPYEFWPLGVFSAGLMYQVLLFSPPGKTAFIGWYYGLGVFGSGASWVYVSIHDYGYTAAPLAALLTFLFAAFLALFCVLQAVVFKRFILRNRSHSLLLNSDQPAQPVLLSALSFAAVWVLTDWLRSWLLTGFPWLYLGYGHVLSPLANLAPLGGVHLITLVVALTGALLSLFATPFRSRSSLRWGALMTATLWLGAALLPGEGFTQPASSTPLKVALAQGNINQLLKWQAEHRMHSIEVYERLSAPLWEDTDILLWPETAIPFFQDTADFLLQDLSRRAQDTHTTLITGIPYRLPPRPDEDYPVMHNSITSLGSGSGIYHKQKLVPFGEYVPLQSVLRGIIRFLDLPMSAFQPGQPNQPGLLANGYVAAPFICYEIVYPDFVAESAQGSHFLVTISNDAWFGASIGPLQHLQIAQMRSLETGRYTLRGTNNGITAIVDPRGRVMERAPQFEEAMLIGTITPMTGNTPFMLTGSLPVVLFCFLICVLTRQARPPEKPLT